MIILNRNVALTLNEYLKIFCLDGADIRNSDHGSYINGRGE